MKRRDFIKTPGYFIAAAALGKTTACGDNVRPNVLADASGATVYSFPQGVASGDPRDTSVVLWTRVQDSAGSSEPITVRAEVAADQDLGTLIVDQELTVDASSDHTLRLLVTGLDPQTVYYYRFRVGQTMSTVGRTLTAPPTDDTAPVRLAWVSCQDYATGFYHAYRDLMATDDALPEAERIQFVVHMGDFIYETVGEQFQGAIDENLEPIELVDRNGVPRRVAPLPDGVPLGDSSYARTLADYRHLYKEFLRDPDLLAARARWPFIYTWDDHEFTNDSWQTQANYEIGTSLDEPAQERKVAANQAWFEFIPCNLSDAQGVPGVTQNAHDFVATQVTDTAYSEVDADNLITEDNNLAALASLTIYRSIRYGQNVELVVTDTRSYRSDHAIPEEVTAGNPVFFDPRNAVPRNLTDIMDAGMLANGGNPPPDVLGIPNTRAESPPGAMLGSAQKTWFKDTLQMSDATWKVWANSAPFMRLVARNEPPDILLTDRIASSDAWDGYHTERTELGTFIRDSNIQNLVIITGDVHSHWVGKVVDDYNAPSPMTIGAEFVAAGVSSNSMFSFYENAVRGLEPALRGLVTYDAEPFGGQDRFVNNLNNLFINGAGAARVAEASHDLAQIEAASDPLANPHLAFIDTDAQGYGVLTVTADDISATMVTVNRPLSDEPSGPMVKYTARFTMNRDDPDSLTGPIFEGPPPFPYPGSI